MNNTFYNDTKIIQLTALFRYLLNYKDAFHPYYQTNLLTVCARVYVDRPE